MDLALKNLQWLIYHKTKPKQKKIQRLTKIYLVHLCKSEQGARGVVVIVVRNGHVDTSSNPGRD